MSEIKLSDQLGAMAIVDSLYAQHIAVEEHLNLPDLRNKIARRIREYYQSTGVDINDELIEQGVQRWFANRLRYKTPSLSLWQRAVTYLYLTNAHWIKIVGILVLIVALLVGYSLFTQQSELQVLQQHFATVLNVRNNQDERAHELMRSLPSLREEKFTFAGKPAAKIIDETEKALGEFNANHKTISPLKYKTDRKYISERLETETRQNNAQSILLDRAMDKIKPLLGLMEGDKKLSALINDPNYNGYARRSPELASRVSAATAALSQGAEDAETKIALAVSTFMLEKQRSEWHQELAQHIDKFKALPLSATDRHSVNTQIDSVKALLQSPDLSPQDWNNAVTALNDTYSLIVTPLALRVVDRVGEKSGVERTYNNSGGRSWYLIAEAVTAQGNVFPLIVKDSETGEQKKVRTFGIRISQSEFEKLKWDKKQDGHIDNALVGRKPINRLEFQYVRPIMNGYITDW